MRESKRVRKREGSDRKGRLGAKRHLCIKPLFIRSDDDISSGFLPLQLSRKKRQEVC